MDRETQRYILLACNKVKPYYFSIDEIMDVFDCYFMAYARAFLKTHPHLKLEQIERIIKKMPYIGGMVAEPYWYCDLIDQHFKTGYGKCDYNINHFFSGRIRELRYYEVYC